MALRAADARQLVQVEDLHASSRRYTASSSSAIRPVAKRVRTSAAPFRPSRARSSGSRASSASGARARPCRRPASRNPLSPVDDDGRRSARPRRDDRPLGRERLDRDDRRALVRGGQQRERRRRRTSSRIRCWKPTSRQCSATPSSRASASALGPVLAVADEHEHGVDAVVAARARSVRTRSSGRLIAVSLPAQPIANVSSASPSSPRTRARASSSAGPHSGRSNPYGTTVKRSAGGDAEARRGRPAPRR